MDTEPERPRMETSADPTLLSLLDEIRRKTLSLLDGLTDEQARWTPTGLQNSILWHAGHSYVVLEWLTMGAIGAETTCPPEWFDLFSWNSRPGQTPPDRWPSLAQVVDELRLQHGRMHKLLRNLNPDYLDNPARDRPDSTVRFRMIEALHDEANHQGEIWLLKKLQAV